MLELLLLLITAVHKLDLRQFKQTNLTQVIYIFLYY